MECQASKRDIATIYFIMSVIDHSNVEISFAQLNQEIADTGLTAFRLSEVAINGDEDDMYTFVRSFRGHPNIRELSLNDVSCTAPEVTLDNLVSTVLVSLPNIEILRLDKMAFSSSTVASVGYCSTLAELSLRNSSITDKDAGVIAQALSDSDSIQSIDLTGNKELSDMANALFAQALDKNMSLRTIKLDDLKTGGEHRATLTQKLSQRTSQAA